MDHLGGNDDGVDDEDNNMKSDALYLLKLKAGHRLSQKALNDTVECTREPF